MSRDGEKQEQHAWEKRRQKRTEVLQAGFLMVVYSSFLETSTATDWKCKNVTPATSRGPRFTSRLDSGFRRNDETRDSGAGLLHLE